MIGKASKGFTPQTDRNSSPGPIYTVDEYNNIFCQDKKNNAPSLNKGGNKRIVPGPIDPENRVSAGNYNIPSGFGKTKDMMVPVLGPGYNRSPLKKVIHIMKNI